MRSAFAGSAAEYNKLVEEELDAIQTALDGVSDDCDNLDYDIAVCINRLYSWWRAEFYR